MPLRLSLILLLTTGLSVGLAGRGNGSSSTGQGGGVSEMLPPVLMSFLPRSPIDHDKPAESMLAPSPSMGAEDDNSAFNDDPLQRQRKQRSIIIHVMSMMDVF